MILLCFLFVYQDAVFAQNVRKRAPKVNTLDFEAEVIEGERAKPDVFVQLGSGAQSMNSVLYSRDNFNDYHAVDRKYRPGFVDLKEDRKK